MTQIQTLIILQSLTLILLAFFLFKERERVITSLITQNKVQYWHSAVILRICIILIAVVFLIVGIKLILVDFKKPDNFIKHGFEQSF